MVLEGIDFTTGDISIFPAGLSQVEDNEVSPFPCLKPPKVDFDCFSGNHQQIDRLKGKFSDPCRKGGSFFEVGHPGFSLLSKPKRVPSRKTHPGAIY